MRFQQGADLAQNPTRTVIDSVVREPSRKLGSDVRQGHGATTIVNNICPHMRPKWLSEP
jgi:hypothetical protein